HLERERAAERLRDHRVGAARERQPMPGGDLHDLAITLELDAVSDLAHRDSSETETLTRAPGIVIRGSGNDDHRRADRHLREQLLDVAVRDRDAAGGAFAALGLAVNEDLATERRLPRRNPSRALRVDDRRVFRVRDRAPLETASRIALVRVA